MASNRINRINEEIQKELSSLLRTVKDPRVQDTMISITHVETTPDLRYAKVYVSFLEEAMDRDGVLTRGVCLEAEERLAPCGPAAKEYKLILAGHAHIDMDWMWSYHETVALTLSTFRTVLNLMNQYPEFCFSQSQASVYKMVEEYDPDMMEEIKARIREGRWEVTASAWVETDKNMPSTESLLRHIAYTKNYLQEVWGVDPDSLLIDFSPDTFGHSAFIPEIKVTSLFVHVFVDVWLRLWWDRE